jgi:hypothetical protein
MSIRIRTAFIAILVAMASLAGCGEAGAAITRLAVGEPGPDAYALVSGTDDPKVIPRQEAGGARTGDQPGLYGGTRKVASCDKDKLVKFLGDNPDKAKAWADVHHITPAGIPAFIEHLTPVVLRVDTAVTNHGYRSGEATSLQAVLQAGVGVLVDAHGVPVVKCNCGNPLTAPSKKTHPENGRYTGTKWPQFAKKKVTVIEAPAQEVKTLMLVDPVLGMIFPRPVGTEGESDGALAPMPPEAMPVSATPTAGPTDVSQSPPGEGPSTESATPGDPTGPAQEPSETPPASAQPTEGDSPAVTVEPQASAPEPQSEDPPPSQENQESNKVQDEPKSDPAAEPADPSPS